MDVTDNKLLPMSDNAAGEKHNSKSAKVSERAKDHNYWLNITYALTHALHDAGKMAGKRLHSDEIILLGIIVALSRNGVCTASNDYLAAFTNRCRSQMAINLQRLAEGGFVTIHGYTCKRQIIPTERSLQLCAVTSPEFRTSTDTTNPESQTSTDVTGPKSRTKSSGILDINNKDKSKDNNNIRKSDLFEKFWNTYPKKRDKKKAAVAFSRIKNLPAIFDNIMQSLEQQKKSKQWQSDGGQYIPYPTTWINGERWNDELEQQSLVASGSACSDVSPLLPVARSETEKQYQARVNKQLEELRALGVDC